VAGGGLIHLLHILHRRRRTLNLGYESTVGKRDDVGWQTRNAIEASGPRRVVGIQFDEHEVCFQSLGRLGLGEDFVL
jgi:hypothetical protein